MSVENVYTSASCNQTPGCADWNSNGLIAFGANHAIGILDPKYLGKSAKITNTYVQHKARVIAVQWVRKNSNIRGDYEMFLVTGDDGGGAILWKFDNMNSNVHQAPMFYILGGHEKAVRAVTGVQLSMDSCLCLTASNDGIIKFWSFMDNAVTCMQTFSLGNDICMAMCLGVMPETDRLILAVSVDKEKILLYSQPIENGDFVQQHALNGHEDWVFGLDFVTHHSDLVLASGSHDTSIRLWRISPRTEREVISNNQNRNFEELDEVLHIDEQIVKIAKDAWVSVSLESVLYGHDGWIYNIHWHKDQETQALRLLSASIDKTLIVWVPANEGVWIEKLRVGEVGGHSLGFYGGMFSRDGKSIFGYSYQGGFHLWQKSDEGEVIWVPTVIVGGHFKEVRDLGWDPKGAYLMTVSADQTTRIHGCWKTTNTWHEIARPQVHGHDMQALAILSRYKFASGAEEKIVRTFQAPANFIENLRSICQITDDVEGDNILKTLPQGASVPSLGLSNKAVFTVDEIPINEKDAKDLYPENYFIPISLDAPPQEELLMQNTLWPEVQKLYGHGYEIYALAASPDGKLLASSCRATNTEHAQIILWSTRNWKQLQKLASHQLTVTQLRFSPNGHYLLSVSRDRRWSLFERQGGMSYALTASTDKSNGIHSRIIWSCDWSYDNKYFATSSRDGKVVVWSKADGKTSKENSSLNGWEAVSKLELKNEAVTAIAFAPKVMKKGEVVALGLESGLIKIYTFTNKWEPYINLEHDQAHHKSVNRLQFNPNKARGGRLLLASCGEDHLVRINAIEYS